MIEKILEEREKAYGGFEKVAFVSQSLKSAVRYEKGWTELYMFEQEAIEMILHKIARIVNGGSKLIDEWLDIAGYATLAVENIKERNKYGNS